MVRVVEELLVYQKALDASDEISAMLKAKEFAKDRRLREQLGAASERVVSSISEGFEQSTDRHFASYLYRAKGSSSETRTQLRVARARGYLSEATRLSIAERYLEIEKMLRSLIRRLDEDDWRNRR